ncbi:DUF4956 domain-containing protein [Segeticoccus rhizosphaerae]|uniref:DUF4956 domain-containing protein n=1 Tax=Segeticoccus rhizosphaerae TaxID=1104777 RepID=UPI001EE4610D|nr:MULTISPECIES: DUF4956 domain-containing protein [Intrasporangiaceae]
MNLIMAITADLAAITLLVFGVYYRRHFRRDLVLAYVALNVGIMAVAALLAGSGAGIGLGMGLFGILSIIRLRSDAITQEEVAYYFIALALGLVNGLHPGPIWLAPAVSGGLVLVMYAADHPRFAPRTRRQTVTMDTAYPREPSLRAALEQLLDADVLHVVVLELDLVRDTTVVDVRFRSRPQPVATRGQTQRPGRELAGQSDLVAVTR